MPIAPTPQTPQQPMEQKTIKPGADLSPKPGMGYWEYFQYLLSQGVPAIQASQIIESNPNYGTPDQWNEKQARNTEKADKYGAYGKLAGAIGTAALIDAFRGSKAPASIGSLTSSQIKPGVEYAQATPQGSVVARGQTVGGENYLAIRRPIPESTLDLDKLAAQQGQGGTAASQYQGPATQTTSLPDQQYTYGETTTVQTNAGPREMPIEAAKDAEFVQGTDWNQVGNGALAALQAYQAFQSFKNKDYIGAGISGTTAGLSAGTAVYGSQSTAAAALPYAGGAAALYGGYQTAKLTGAMPKSKQRDVKSAVGGAAAGAAGGAAIGSQIGAVGGPLGMGIGAALGAAAGYAGSKFGSSKGKGQTLRDNLRANLQETGALDENFQGTLADGSK